jgi:cobalamin-dependent methionine synthase I
LEKIKENLSFRAVLGFFPVLLENEDVILYRQDADPGKPEELARFCFLRNQVKQSSNMINLCLSDNILPVDERQSRYYWLGLFVLTAEFINEKPQGVDRLLDDEKAPLAATLANSLAEAFSVELFNKVKEDYWPVSLDPAF